MGKTIRISGQPISFKTQKKNLKTVLKRVDRMSLQKKKALYKRFTWLDDWLLQRTHLKEVLSKITWEPNMDAACDIHGSNKHFEHFCSTKRDALLQDLSPYNVYCNVPYLLSKEFIHKFEVTKDQHQNFKAVIIIPLRPSN